VISPWRVSAGLGGMFFLTGLSMGMYVPPMTNIVTAAGHGSGVVQWAWLVWPLATLVSPLWLGALADHRFPAERVLGWSGLVSAAALALAFAALDHEWGAGWFVGWLFVSWLLAAPQWSVLSAVAMKHLVAREREFPVVRLGATLGWMGAGYVVSYLLRADTSPAAGYAGAGVRVAASLLAFRLPSTPPPGASRSWRTLLGLDAFALLRERDHAVFFATTVLLSMPLAAFFMWTPPHLAALGDERPTATMALGQLSEIVAMLGLAALMVRMRVKWLLVLALVLCAVRYGLFAWSGWSGERLGLVIGISLHGLCYTFYFITAQIFIDRRVRPELRAQAQGLIALASGGVGTLLGTIGVRLLHDGLVGADGSGWGAYWGWLALWLALLSLAFTLAYRGRANEPSGQSP